MPGPPPPHIVTNGLSVDVEDYFQVSAFDRVVSRDGWPAFQRRVVSNTERLLGVFGECGVRATFFVLGWIAEREPALVRQIAAAGHELASHGFWHRLVYDQTPEEFRQDVRRSKALLEELGGRTVLGYRAPSFSITLASIWALDVLAEEGFAYDASVFPIRHDRYGIPSAPRHPFRTAEGVFAAGRTGGRAVGGPRRSAGSSGVAEARGFLEVPPSTVRLGRVNLPVAGGGYFRLLPYAWTRWGIARVNHVEGKPVVFYLHPWEIDPAQPRIAVPWVRAIRHYGNLARTEHRLRRLLAEFRFDTIEAVMLAPAAVAARG